MNNISQYLFWICVHSQHNNHSQCLFYLNSTARFLRDSKKLPGSSPCMYISRSCCIMAHGPQNITAQISMPTSDSPIPYLCCMSDRIFRSKSAEPYVGIMMSSISENMHISASTCPIVCLSRGRRSMLYWRAIWQL